LVLRASAFAYAAATQFVPPTLARRDEVASACWRDVDLKTKQWRSPETKNKQEQVAPLSQHAIAPLRTRLPETPPPMLSVAMKAMARPRLEIGTAPRGSSRRTAVRPTATTMTCRRALSPAGCRRATTSSRSVGHHRAGRRGYARNRCPARFTCHYHMTCRHLNAGAYDT